MGRLPRLFRRQPPADARFDFLVDVKPQFVIDVALHARAAQEIPETRPTSVPASHRRPQVGLRIIEIAADSRCQSFCSFAR